MIKHKRLFTDGHWNLDQFALVHQGCPDCKRKNLNIVDQNGEATSKKRRTLNASELAFLSSDLAKIMPDDRKIFLEGMGVDISQVKLVIEKTMTATDRSTNHGRFNIPFNQVKHKDFLTPEEKRTLRVGNGKGQTFHLEGSKVRKKELKVKLIEPCLKETKMLLKVWDLMNTFCYVLTGEWNSVLANKENGSNLDVGKFLQLWSFRLNGELYFSLNKIEMEEADSVEINNIGVKIESSPSNEKLKKSPSLCSALDQISPKKRSYTLQQSSDSASIQEVSGSKFCTVLSHVMTRDDDTNPGVTVQGKNGNELCAALSPVKAIEIDTNPDGAIQESSNKFRAEPSPIVTIDNETNSDITVATFSFCDYDSVPSETEEAVETSREALRNNLGLKSSVHRDSSAKQIKLHITKAGTDGKVEDPKLLDAILLTIINPLVGYPPEVVFGFKPE